MEVAGAGYYMKKVFLKITLGVVLVCILFVGFLYVNNDIGVASTNLEADMSDHTFSVYVNRPGFSFGYFFRGGGSLSGVERGIIGFTVEEYKERAFISMNQQRVTQLQIDDGNSIQGIYIDSNKPFAIVLPINAGTITFYDVNGNTVEYWNNPL